MALLNHLGMALLKLHNHAAAGGGSNNSGGNSGAGGGSSNDEDVDCSRSNSHGNRRSQTALATVDGLLRAIELSLGTLVMTQHTVSLSNGPRRLGSVPVLARPALWRLLQRSFVEFITGAPRMSCAVQKRSYG